VGLAALELCCQVILAGQSVLMRACFFYTKSLCIVFQQLLLWVAAGAIAGERALERAGERAGKELQVIDCMATFVEATCGYVRKGIYACTL
jgi:hypothetical protein